MDNSFLESVKARELNLASFMLLKKPEKICYLEADEMTVMIFLEDGAMVRVSTMLHCLEEVLPPEKFFRCGWSFIVNLDKIESIWRDENDGAAKIVVAPGSIIPVPKSQVSWIEHVLEVREQMAHE